MRALKTELAAQPKMELRHTPITHTHQVMAKLQYGHGKAFICVTNKMQYNDASTKDVIDDIAAAWDMIEIITNIYAALPVPSVLNNWHFHPQSVHRPCFITHPIYMVSFVPFCRGCPCCHVTHGPAAVSWGHLDWLGAMKTTGLGFHLPRRRMMKNSNSRFLCH